MWEVRREVVKCVLGVLCVWEGEVQGGKVSSSGNSCSVLGVIIQYEITLNRQNVNYLRLIICNKTKSIQFSMY